MQLSETQYQVVKLFVHKAPEVFKKNLTNTEAETICKNFMKNEWHLLSSKDYLLVSQSMGPTESVESLLYSVK